MGASWLLLRSEEERSGCIWEICNADRASCVLRKSRKELRSPQNPHHQSQRRLDHLRVRQQTSRFSSLICINNAKEEIVCSM